MTSSERGRGSKQAVEKRRAARALNAVVDALGGGVELDGRTERRKRRLVKELVSGRRGAPLKAIDFVAHASELMALGESPASLRRLGVKSRKMPLDPALLTAVERTQAAYGFDVRAWKMLGVKAPGPAVDRGRKARAAAPKSPDRKSQG
jgi:hypothetical protein